MYKCIYIIFIVYVDDIHFLYILYILQCIIYIGLSLYIPYIDKYTIFFTYSYTNNSHINYTVFTKNEQFVFYLTFNSIQINLYYIYTLFANTIYKYIHIYILYMFHI